ncbi:MAG: AraC family transcriptional regulator [Clostridiales bacterium]|jgi:YesN/AraC family two-component response regulator|nr:AraC family transcriptional regulator [Clostridiales bacterium]
MHHLLLVDDEDIALRGMYDLLLREFKDLAIYKASSGSEAIARLESSRIDIAVIDISMPGMSGLELQKIIVKKWPLCRTLFLTGYDVFEYAKEAIRSGGADYILKLEGDEVVLSALRKNIGILEDEEKKRAELALKLDEAEESGSMYEQLHKFARGGMAAACREYAAANVRYIPGEYYRWAVAVNRLMKQLNLAEEASEKINYSSLFDFNSFSCAEAMHCYISEVTGAIFQILRERGSQNMDRHVAEVNNYICNNLEKDLSIATLADCFHFNPSYLSRMYKKKMGMSMSEYICEQRLKKARQLLSASNCKIKDVAEAAGFSSPSYFTQCFSRAFSISPQEYRVSK